MVVFGNKFNNTKQNTKKIIDQAFLLHSQGNIKAAFENYKYCIELSLKDESIYDMDYDLLVDQSRKNN